MTGSKFDTGIFGSALCAGCGLAAGFTMYAFEFHGVLCIIAGFVVSGIAVGAASNLPPMLLGLALGAVAAGAALWWLSARTDSLWTALGTVVAFFSGFAVGFWTAEWAADIKREQEGIAIGDRRSTFRD